MPNLPTFPGHALTISRYRMWRTCVEMTKLMPESRRYWGERARWWHEKFINDLTWIPF